jgi:RNA polymerase sigma-70 factor, ECF subfamily
VSSTEGPTFVAELVSAARSAWPDVEVPADLFASYVWSRVPPGEEADVYVRRMRTNDLYLACACARGDARAIELFERHCLGVIGVVLSRMDGMSGDVVEEVKQQLRRRLLVAEGGPPGIVQFSGKGELRRWVKVLAVRQALKVRRRTGREEPAADRLLERALLPAGNPLVDYLKRLYQHEFATAIAEALPRLSGREQTLLRQSFIDGLSIDELGRFYRVHRATAARWLVAAQSRLSAATRVILKRRLNVNPSELSSILRLVRSGLELSRVQFPDRVASPEEVRSLT